MTDELIKEGLEEGEEGGKEEELPKKEEEKGKTPEEHPTKLGRRVSKMEEQMGTFLSKFDLFLEKMDEEKRSSWPSTPQKDPDEDPQVDELEQKLERRRLQRMQEQQAQESLYASEYIKTVQKGFEEEEELHTAVKEELLESNYKSYLKHTGDPRRDAQINYNMALAAVLKRNRGGKVPNVRGDRKHSPTGLSSSSHMGEPLKKTIELDPFASKFVRSLGAKEDDEWVQNALRDVK